MKPINKACLQKPRTQTPSYADGPRPHVDVRPAKQVGWSKRYSSAKELRIWLAREEAQTEARYHTDWNK